jgi:hypothetical protein
MDSIIKLKSLIGINRNKPLPKGRAYSEPGAIGSLILVGISVYGTDSWH